jgi:hypothetical protein
VQAQLGPANAVAMASAGTMSGSNAPTRRKSRQAVDVAEKDDVELRLEKALFGDDAGFLDSLSAAKYGEGKELDLYDSDNDHDGDADGDLDLADVADEDVSAVLLMLR